MNLKKLEYISRTADAESKRAEIDSDPWRLRYHLMPPVGWLNDPNGLCQKDGVYHTFFQYSPTNARGDFKAWGHYSGRDLTELEYQRAEFFPDEEFDRSGVYSGSAIVENGIMHLFYTGNVKEEGEHDYTHSGRRADTVHVTSADGVNFSKKEVVIPTSQYPQGYSCHIRDPKVWKKDGMYYMVLGARTSNDNGAALIYASEDLENWILANEIRSEGFGYMWECPDYFELGDKKIFSCSPQGIARGTTQFQNIYSAGYVELSCDIHDLPQSDTSFQCENYTEWDYGFDFYAPQTFEDEQGRRILAGWMGLPDVDAEYTNPTVERGWQHCLTMFREISIEGTSLIQRPVSEYEDKFKTVDINISTEATDKLWTIGAGQKIIVDNSGNKDLQLCIADGLMLTYSKDESIFKMRFTDEKLGSGRGTRCVEIADLTQLEIYIDTSAIELYLNKGVKVMSTRFYPQTAEYSLEIK